MLLLVEGYTDLYRCTETDQIINLGDFFPFEATADLRGRRYADIRLSDREYWIPDHWSIVIHPWVEIIPPSIKVSFAAQSDYWTKDMPLFRVAEPLKRSVDSDLERRLAHIEAHMGIVADGRTDGGKLSPPNGYRGLIRPDSVVGVELDGSTDELGRLFEHAQHFFLCVRGFRWSLR